MRPDAIVEQLAAAIAEMKPVDERHATSIQQFLGCLADLAAPLDEHAGATHVTASAIVVSHRGTLLHRHKRLGLWLQPGGHIDPGETPWDAALRETLEETGLQGRHPEGRPNLVHVDVHPGGRGHRHLDLRYLVLTEGEDPAPPSTESQDVRWFDWPTAIGLADHGLAGALRALAPHMTGMECRTRTDG